MEDLKSKPPAETNITTGEKPVIAEPQAKPKSAGNKSFRKHNKLGFYRLMQKKKKEKNRKRGL